MKLLTWIMTITMTVASGSVCAGHIWEFAFIGDPANTGLTGTGMFEIDGLANGVNQGTLTALTFQGMAGTNDFTLGLDDVDLQRWTYDAVSMTFSDLLIYSSARNTVGGIDSFTAVRVQEGDLQVICDYGISNNACIGAIENGRQDTYEGTFAYLGQVPHENVPITGTLSLFGLGLAGLGWSRRKKA